MSKTTIEVGRAMALPPRSPLDATAPATKPITIDPLLHPRDVAKMLGVSMSWLAKSRLTGTGPRFVKIGRAVRYTESGIRDFIKSRMRGSTSEK